MVIVALLMEFLILLIVALGVGLGVLGVFLVVVGATVRRISAALRALVAVCGLVALMVSGLCLAFGLRPLLQLIGGKTSANMQEQPALGLGVDEVHKLVQAETGYQAANGGFFDTPPCLAQPQACIPGYAGQPFLDAPSASLGTRGAYTWSFHPGPPAAPEPSRARRISPSSLLGYAVVAVPRRAAPGARSICGDATGRICTFIGPESVVKTACPDVDCARHVW